MKSNEERLQDLLAYVDSLTRVHPSEIPGIDLYMDQVTTFMDSHLNTSKWLGEDKIPVSYTHLTLPTNSRV